MPSWSTGPGGSLGLADQALYVLLGNDFAVDPFREAFLDGLPILCGHRLIIGEFPWRESSPPEMGAEPSLDTAASRGVERRS